MTPEEFVQKWANTPLAERNSYQLHFIDVCHLMEQEPPSASGTDGRGNAFQFERSLKKDTGQQGFADVFYENHFAIEYKAPGVYETLDAAYQQLQRYREKLNNPPLLVVTDIYHWEIHTNFNNAASKVYKFTHDEIRQPHIRTLLRKMFTDPFLLHPNRTAEQVTRDAADAFRTIADQMRQWNAEPGRIAHFMTKLVFCLFAEDTGLLPALDNGNGLFTEIVVNSRKAPSQFQRYMTDLFKAMTDGGNLFFKEIPYFNGSLFDDVTVEQLELEPLTALETASRLDWSSIEPSIFGTLFERSLDPSKRAQLGAHYTSREDIMLIVEPVLMQPLRREWERIKAEADAIREKIQPDSTQRVRTTHMNKLESLREEMLRQLREIKVLDPACGSGNFLYVSLQLLMDLEKAVITDPVWVGLNQPFPEVHPRQLYGIEINPIAHALASIVVWIGYIQWKATNGYPDSRKPILEDLHGNIQLMDAIIHIPTPTQPAVDLPLPKAFSLHDRRNTGRW